MLNYTSLLTNDEREQVYREVELEYRMKDAERHINNMYNDGSISGVDYKSVNEFVLKAIAEDFLENIDCNRPENDVFEEVINKFFKNGSEF